MDEEKKRRVRALLERLACKNNNLGVLPSPAVPENELIATANSWAEQAESDGISAVDFLADKRARQAMSKSLFQSDVQCNEVRKGLEQEYPNLKVPENVWHQVEWAIAARRWYYVKVEGVREAMDAVERDSPYAYRILEREYNRLGDGHDAMTILLRKGYCHDPKNRRPRRRVPREVVLAVEAFLTEDDPEKMKTQIIVNLGDIRRSANG